jgi:hypothetical protein
MTHSKIYERTARIFSDDDLVWAYEDQRAFSVRLRDGGLDDSLSESLVETLAAELVRRGLA